MEKNLITPNGQLIDIGGTRTDEKAYSGKYSIKLGGEAHYGMKYFFKNINAGDIIKVSAWRYSKANNGIIAVSSDSNLSYYGSKVIIHDAAGWEKISMTMVVPSNYENPGLYLWNNGNSPVYFDDLEVKVFSQFRTKL